MVSMAGIICEILENVRKFGWIAMMVGEERRGVDPVEEAQR